MLLRCRLNQVASYFSAILQFKIIFHNYYLTKSYISLWFSGIGSYVELLTLLKEAETLDDTGTNGVARARPRPSASGGAKATNPFNIALKEVATKWEQNNDADEGEASPLQISSMNTVLLINDNSCK